MSNKDSKRSKYPFQDKHLKLFLFKSKTKAASVRWHHIFGYVRCLMEYSNKMYSYTLPMSLYCRLNFEGKFYTSIRNGYDSFE